MDIMGPAQSMFKVRVTIIASGVMDHVVNRGPLVIHLVLYAHLSRFCSLVTYQAGNTGHGRTVARFVGSARISLVCS